MSDFVYVLLRVAREIVHLQTLPLWNRPPRMAQHSHSYTCPHVFREWRGFHGVHDPVRGARCHLPDINYQFLLLR